MTTAYIGIDPGSPLAMAMVVQGKWVAHASEKMAYKGQKGKGWYNDYTAVAAVLRDWKKFALDKGYKPAIMAEYVTIRPGENLVAGAKFIGSLYAVQGIAAALEVDFSTVTPSVWKRHLGLSSDKKKSLSMARGLYPDRAWRLAKVADHNYAEAALIATYASQTV